MWTPSCHAHWPCDSPFIEEASVNPEGVSAVDISKPPDRGKGKGTLVQQLLTGGHSLGRRGWATFALARGYNRPNLGFFALIAPAYVLPPSSLGC
jgi:hypothetical protein